jgi:hypothetical protein
MYTASAAVYAITNFRKEKSMCFTAISYTASRTTKNFNMPE